MLNRLFSSISAACPIVGVAVGTPGDSSTVRIDFAPEATDEQKAAAQAVLAAFEWRETTPYEDGIAAGHPVTPEGFTLGMTDQDRSQFSQLLTLVNEARSLGLMGDGSPVGISDKDGGSHSVTTLRLRQILVGYGFAYKTLWDNRNA